jgi:UDP-glucose 4-epimerase
MSGLADMASSASPRLDGVSCLVLGAGGFIGSALCRALVRAGARVHGFSRRQAFAGSLPPMRFTAGEFADRASLALAVDGAEIVFHLLGGTNPEVSNKDPIADLQVNTVASVQLLELCRAAGVRKIVFVSSGGTVYGRQDAVPIPETAPTDPISAYGINKLMVEKYLQLYAYLGGPKAVSLRVANPYGPFQSPFRRQGLVPALIETVLAGRKVEIWGDGRVVRDFLYVDDVAEAMVLAALYDGPETVLNVGSGVGRSVREVAESICAMLGRSGTEFTYRPARRADVAANVLDVTRIGATLGWAAQTGWEDGVLLTAEWIKRTFRA